MSAKLIQRLTERTKFLQAAKACRRGYTNMDIQAGMRRLREALCESEGLLGNQQDRPLLKAAHEGWAVLMEMEELLGEGIAVPF